MLCVVDVVQTARRTDFGVAGTVTRLRVRSDQDLTAFDLRATSVFAVPGELALDERLVPDPVPFAGSVLELAGAVPPLAPKQWLAVSGKPARVALAPAAGVFRLDAGGWTPAGLPLRGVRALVPAGRGAAWAACDGGVYATADGGQTWIAVGTGLGAHVPTALVRGADGALYAGTDGAGVLVCRGGTGVWAPHDKGMSTEVVHALALDAFGGVLAGTEAGVWRLDPGAETWRAAGTGLSAVPVAALRVAAGVVYAASGAGGVFRLAPGGDWERLPEVPGAGVVTALEAGPDGTLYAGTAAAGVFRLPPDGGTAWVAVPGLAGAPVHALLASGGAVYAGTAGGVLRSPAGRSGWAPVPLGAANDVWTLAAEPGGALWAGCGPATVLTSADGLRQSALAMTRAAKLPASVAAALDAGTVPAAARDALARGGIKVDPLAQVEVRAPGRAWSTGTAAAPVFLYTLPEGIEAWIPGGLPILTAAPAYAPAPPPFAGAAGGSSRTGPGAGLRDAPGAGFEDVFDVDFGDVSGGDFGDAPGAGSGDVSSIDFEASLGVDFEDTPDDIHGSPAHATDREPRDADGIAAAGGLPSSTAVTGSAAAVRVREVAVRTDAGFAGGAWARDDEWSWQPAAKDDVPAAEVARAASCTVDGGTRTRLVLQAPLEGIYDPASAAVCANVAPATQGQSVSPLPNTNTTIASGEVLGSGDATAVGQQFRLARQPLTYVPDDSAAGARSTLVVRVDGAAWKEVPTLADQLPGATVYAVRTDATGCTTVLFGDGVQGARLPTGVENVRAWYRTGAGAAGNLPAGSITVPRVRPAAVRGITNPVPATGGVDPETPGAVRQTAPLAVRTLGRVVSLSDYADFSRVYPGVSLSRADLLRAAGHPLVAVTVAGVDGAVPDAGLVADLSASIAANRLNAGRFAVLAYEPLWFRFDARVVVDAAFDPDDVMARARAALAASLAFALRTFGGDVRLARLLETLQGVRGVEAVRPSALYVDGLRPALDPRLAAAAGRLDPHTGAPLPAQILLPHPRDGLSLNPASA